jgi:hypothetical protein
MRIFLFPLKKTLSPRGGASRGREHEVARSHTAANHGRAIGAPDDDETGYSSCARRRSGHRFATRARQLTASS